jgi:lysozyme family protein
MADFNVAVSITLDPQHEGGFQKNPKDKGNWTGGQIGVGELRGTNHGISAAEFPNVDIEHLTPAQAAQIYFTAPQGYWKAIYAQIQEQIIANKLFDLGVLFGPGIAIEILQKVLQPQFSDVVADKVFGPATLAAVNGSEPTSLLQAYKTAFVARAIIAGANNPAEREDVSDWIRRINS